MATLRRLEDLDAVARVRAEENRTRRVVETARNLFVRYWPLIITEDSDEELAESCLEAAEAFETMAEKRTETVSKKKKR
jgi:hypothetical protein